ncbi:MAG TPA: archease [Nitrospiraceae bacterium]|nr:archease [Nitrospiraceae bacterium]
MKKFETLDISGDVGLKVWAQELGELFENAALGMFELITNTDAVSEKEEKEIAIEASDNDSLLVRWLNELIFYFDTYGFIGKRFNVNIEDKKLKAKVFGATFDPESNESRLLVKAATYHMLSLKKTDSLWEATVIFDI